MKKVSIYILATDKNLHRLKLLCEGSISCKKNKLSIILLGDGNKPGFLSSNMTWIDMNHVRIQDKHIYALCNNITKDADYHLFTDDDVMVDVDKMVDSVANQDIKDTPCYWSGETGMTIHHQPEVFNYMMKNNISSYKIERIKECWTGWVFTLVNRAFIRRAQGSPELAFVMRMSMEIYDQFWPDRQIPILGAMINAKHHYRGVNATQWKNYFNYSGLINNGDFWHIHYTVDNNILEYIDIIKTVKNGPFNKIEDLVGSLFKKNLSRKINKKHILNKKFVKHLYFVAWGFGGWHSSQPDDSCTSEIAFLPNGNFDSKDINVKSWKWSEYKKGFLIEDANKNIVFDLRWISNDGSLVGVRPNTKHEPIIDSLKIVS